MEPSDLKFPPSDDARLEGWLRAGALLPPLPDDGFSARVVAALPASAPRLRRRALVCATGAAIGVAFAAANGVFGPDWSAALPQWEHALAQFDQFLADPMLLLALVVAGISVLYAQKSDELRQLF